MTQPMSPFTLLQQNEIKGISPMRTLLLLRKGAQNLGVIAKHCGVTTAAATGIRCALLNAGFTEESTDPKDRRARVQKLTRAGKEVATALFNELKGYEV